ncbi:MAG TPA: hypothetical protein VEC11_14550 [Allosphingosinicella sp.]|nr:hypothetical protein [Allosphingosinicella sp.]
MNSLSGPSFGVSARAASPDRMAPASSPRRASSIASRALGGIDASVLLPCLARLVG